jgi:pimeloyl-ACP methyl ester carboxylesterase
MTITIRTIATSIACLLTASFANAAGDKFFDSHGVKIRYLDQGRGPAVILVHGQGGSIESNWVETGVFENLARDYRVVALDLRGHGKSDKPHETAAYGNEMGLDAVRLMDHLGIKKAHIVGQSLGGYLTSILLTTHPERFITATLAGSGVRTEFSEKARKFAESEAAERERECISRSLTVFLAGPGAPIPSEEEFQKRSKECMANPNEDRFATAAIVRARALQIASPDAVAKTKVPTLAIVGTRDPLQAAAVALQKLRPEVKIVYVDGATHSTATREGLLWRPEFEAALRDFIASH